MGSLLPAALYCISLFFLQLQALPAGSRSGENRLDFMIESRQLDEGSATSPDSDQRSEDTAAPPAVSLDRGALWRALLLRNPPASSVDLTSFLHVSHTAPSMGGASAEGGEEPNRRRPRGRRHAQVRIRQHQPHGQLKRVGCILGTCQVQNLSHRLYQLLGQSGLQDSSPINPRSPHSYG
ncbi:protein ADM2a [Electrophorus electricus]|uniref:Adrenomedullin 2b n=1 Tax=Electrophorus electricus TaxID=8005 RepID=A0A4W4GP37_ELEEL|nr:protein ADM2a [Electrophorus electricus]